MCPTFVVVVAAAAAAAVAAVVVVVVVVVAGQLDICGPIFRFATGLLLPSRIFPFPVRSVTLLPLCGPFCVKPHRVAHTGDNETIGWNEMGWDGMGWDGTEWD